MNHEIFVDCLPEDWEQPHHGETPGWWDRFKRWFQRLLEA